MELHKIYIKTAKGQEEIQHRTCKLSANLRRLLIMVDGRSTTAELVSRLTMLGDPAAGLAELDSGGFIATPAPRAPAPIPAALEPVAQPAPSTFNLEAAKHVIQSALLNAIGPTAEYWIECVEATSTPDQLRIEFDAIRELLPRLLTEPQADQTWRQMEPVMLSLERWLAHRANGATSSPVSSSIGAESAPAEFNLAKAKHVIRVNLIDAMGPAAIRRIERIDAAMTPELLRVELDAVRDMLPKVLSKRQAELVWRQLEPIMQSINTPSS